MGFMKQFYISEDKEGAKVIDILRHWKHNNVNISQRICKLILEDNGRKMSEENQNNVD